DVGEKLKLSRLPHFGRADNPDVDVKNLARQLNDVIGRTAKLLAQLLLEFVFPFVGILHEAPSKLCDVRRGPYRRAGSEDRVVRAKSGVDDSRRRGIELF